MPAWVPSKDKWASWVLESILFLVFASKYQEEAEVLAGLGALLVYAVWLSECPSTSLVVSGLCQPRERSPGTPASWARLRAVGRGSFLQSLSCISLSGSTGKKISVQFCEFLLQVGWKAAS